MEDWNRVEQAIQISYGAQGDERLRHEANKYLSEFQQNPQAALVCLQKLPHPDLMVSVFCFSTLQSAVEMSYDQLSPYHGKIREVLLNFLEMILQQDTVLPLKNIFIKCFVTFFRSEYPESWPNFFNDLLSRSNCMNLVKQQQQQQQQPWSPVLLKAVDIVLRVLLEIDDLVVVLTHRSGAEHERYHSTIIKDTMKESCIPWAVDLWSFVLTSPAIPSVTNPKPGGGGGVVELGGMTLDVISRYARWVDIGIVTKEPFISLYFSLLALPNPDRDDGVDGLKQGACMCLENILHKGMPALEKIRLLQFLNLKEVLYKVAPSLNLDEVDFLSSFGKLVNAYATVCMKTSRDVPKELPQEEQNQLKNGSWGLAEDMLPLVFNLLNHEYDDVSETCLEFVSDYVSILKQNQTQFGDVRGGPMRQKRDKEGRILKDFKMPEVELTELQQNAVNELFKTLSKKIRYDPDFDFTHGDEEKEFNDFRTSLSRLFHNCIALAPGQACSFVNGLVSSCSLQNPSFPEVEGFLKLFYILYEGLSRALFEPPDVKEFFRYVVSHVIQSNVLNYPNIAVKLMCLDVIKRFSAYVPPSMFPTMVASFLDDRSLLSPVPKIRSRTAYQLMKVCTEKDNKIFFNPEFCQEIIKALGPVLDMTVMPGQPETVACLLDSTDKGYVFQTCSTLLQFCPPEICVQGTEMVMGPVAKHCEEALKTNSIDWSSVDVQRHFEGIVAVTAHFLKGFNHPCEGVMPFIGALVERSLQLLEKVKTSSMRAQVLQVLQRAVQSIGDRFFPYLSTSLQLLFRGCKSEDYSRIFLFLNQMTNSYKGKVASVMSDITELVYQIAFDNLQMNTSPNSQEEREQYELHYNYFLFISHLVQYECSAVVINSPKAQETFAMLLQSMKEPAPKVLRCHRMAALVFKNLTEQAQAQSAPSPLHHFLFNDVLPVCFSTLFNPLFSISSPSGRMCVQTMVELHISLISLFGEEGLRAAAGVLEGVNVGEDARRKYLESLKEKRSREASGWLKGVLEPKGGGRHRDRGDRMDRMERYERMGRY